jgi:hypothetical protein
MLESAVVLAVVLTWQAMNQSQAYLQAWKALKVEDGKAKLSNYGMLLVFSFSLPVRRPAAGASGFTNLFQVGPRMQVLMVREDVWTVVQVQGWSDGEVGGRSGGSWSC